MAEARRSFLGYLAAFQVSGVVAAMPLTGRALDPDEINPFPPPVGPRVRAQLDRIRTFIARRRIAALGGA